ncbi:uncharacterized protein CBL_13600 [Carabus blaptoides fortunei]
MRYVAFKSSVSLENIYPQSCLKLFTPDKPASKGTEFTGYIPIDELEITYSRSTGPGGQNVNKVNTKVDLRFHVQTASWLTDDIKSKVVDKYKTQVTKEGFIVFRSDLTRSQQLNLADCLQKLRKAIWAVAISNPEPSQETLEKLRRRREKSAREMLMVKRQRSQIKTDRQSPTVNDY